MQRLTSQGFKFRVADWDATPESVKAVGTVLSERLAYIEEQLRQNSQNSSRPPSSDGFSKPDKLKGQKKKKPKKNSSSSGSSHKARQLYRVESCSEVHYHVPEIYQHCGEELTGKDEQPYRHQIVEIPPLSAYVPFASTASVGLRLLWQEDPCQTASGGAIDRLWRPISGRCRLVEWRTSSKLKLSDGEVFAGYFVGSGAFPWEHQPSAEPGQ